MKKRVVSLLLSTALLTSSALAAEWPAWAEGARNWAQESSIGEGFTAESGTVMTRGMTAQLLYEAAGKPAVSGKLPFSDVSGVYANAVTWAAEQGIVDGVGGGRYAPELPVTRQEFAAVLYRQAGKPQVVSGGLAPFQDAGETADWAFDAVNWCVRAGLIVGKTTDQLAPMDTITTAEALLILQRAAHLTDLTQMKRDLDMLTTAPRPIGSEGEQNAVQYLKDRFEQMGYAVTLQPYVDGQGREGSNVIAVKNASKPDADILVLSAHHDSAPTACGANDNASGVAALLSAAEALRDIPTDTEVRFISFTDEESGKKGSRFYTSTLTEEERERMIGDIQFDMLGGLGSRGALVCTADGEANWVSDLLMEQDETLGLAAETASDHAAFQLAGVPSVLLMQNGRGYLYHSAADTADQLDLYAIDRAVQTVVSAANTILSFDTASYRETARAQGSGYTYRQTRQNVIYFDTSREDTEAYIGAAGEMVEQKIVEGTGWKDTYDTYRYSMRWFGGDTPMNTDYQYRNGFLQSIEVRPFETGYTMEELHDLLTAMYGEPTRSGADRAGNPYESWQDEIYSKYITLTDAPAGCTVSVGKYSVGISNTLATYEVVNGEAEIADPEHKKVWDYLCSILPVEDRQKIAEFQLFTDGASGILAYTAPIRDKNGVSDNSRFSISVDYYDVYDENGAERDWSKLTYTLLHEYGHVLLEDETQIDLSLVDTTHDPAGFVEGSFRKGFYDAFWAELPASGVGDYEQNPTHYVSRYGANYFHEDIADTFAVFLLGGEPKGNTVAEEKLRFFWNDPDMMALRTVIRENLRLEQADVKQPEQPGGPAIVTALEALTAQLRQAIAAVKQPPVFEVSALADVAYLDLEVRNAYYRITSDHPEYKYAYDISTQRTGDLLTCTFSYMPYRSGDYPSGFDGVEVSGLASLIRTAQEHLDQENVPIRITNRTLTVDDMNRALQQTGGSYLLCQLNRDATAITITPMNGMTKSEALARLEELDALAENVYQDCVTPGMALDAQAQALYSWLTEQVRYDFRYYSDPTRMPYQSTTAYGALKDKLAICGGYAQAVQMLFERAGIPCVTVSGKLGGENHMWNLALLDGEWKHFDATSDRGRANYGFCYFNKEGSQMPRHTWEPEWVEPLTAAVTP